MAWDRSHPPGLACSTLMWAMKSSVTVASEISVMSSLCLLISPSRRSNGPVKLSRVTSNAVAARGG